MNEIDQGIVRADCGQNRRCRMIPRIPSTPITTNHSSITGPKMLPMNAVPLRWTRNRPTRITMLRGTTTGASRGRVDLEAFDRAEHRDCRRDHAVAIEQRGADQADDQQGGAPAAAWCVPDVEQRQQRHNAAFAVIVGAHDQDRVFERDDHDQRPQDQRHDAHDRVGVGAPPAWAACLKA